MKKLEKINKILYTIILTAFTTLVFVVNISQPNMSFYANESKAYQLATEIWLSVKEFDIIYVTMAIFVFYAYYKIYFNQEKLNKKDFVNSIIAVILSAITIIGKSYKIDNTLATIFGSTSQLIKCILLSIGYYFMFYAILKAISSIKIEKNNKKKSKKLEKIINFINKHQTLLGLIIIIIFWLPYVIFYYPGASTGDTFDSLSQYFHRSESWSIQTVNLINKNVYINKHHPPLFTVVLGLIFEIGKKLGSYEIGALIYTILQIILLLIIFLYMLRYMKKNNVPLWIRILSILFIASTPTIAAYAITAIKDTPSSIFTLLYVIFLLQITRNYNSLFKNKIKLMYFLVTMLLVMMLRNNGIITILLSFPLLFILYKEKWKKLLLVLLIPVTLFGLYDKVLLPSLDITNGSIKEMLTIPFMQVARVVTHNKDKIPEEDQKIIEKVVSYDSMKSVYIPNLADSIKDTYKKNCTKEDLKNFFKLWFRYLKKYPTEYIESIMNSTYGYFFPEVGEEYATLAVDSRVGIGTYIDIHPKEKYKDARYISQKINQVLAKLPITSIFNHVAFYDWLLIFATIYVIEKKKYKYLIPLAPLHSVLLVCLASPINGSFRYIMPIVFSAPIIVTIVYFSYNEEQKIKM